MLVAVAAAVPAGASWSGGGGGGGAATAAKQLDPVAAPTANASNRDVAVAWAAAAGGAPPSGYTVRRYDGGQGSPAGGSCSGTVTAQSCTDPGVAPGTYTYKVRPIRASWSGAESPASGPVSIAAPSLSLNTTTVNSFPAVLTGQLYNLIGGQTVSYRLDDPVTGPVLSGTTTPPTIPAGGSANVTVTIPAGTSNGGHAVYAIGSAGDVASRPITVNAPTVTGSVIAKSAGGRAGKVRAGGTYYVYANVSGSGNPPAGLATLSADVSALTSGATAVALTHGSWTVAGSTYNYRSAQQTVGASVTAGSKAYSLKLTDSGGTQTTTNHTVTVDNTKPAAVDVQTTNVSGGTTGRAELGDTLTLTYSEQIEETSILAGWDGAATSVVVRLNNGVTDSVRIYNAANTVQLPLGTVDLAANSYTTANRTFGATGTPSTMVTSGNDVTITLGTASGTVTTASVASAMIWTPSATATDAAGNAAATTTATESGSPTDKNF